MYMYFPFKKSCMLWDVIQFLLWVSICHNTPCCEIEFKEVHGDKVNILEVITIKVTGYSLLINIHEKILPSFSPRRN